MHWLLPVHKPGNKAHFPFMLQAIKSWRWKGDYCDVTLHNNLYIQKCELHFLSLAVVVWAEVYTSLPDFSKLYEVPLMSTFCSSIPVHCLFLLVHAIVQRVCKFQGKVYRSLEQSQVVQDRERASKDHPPNTEQR